MYIICALGIVPNAQVLLSFGQLGEPLLEVTHPLLAVDEVLIGAPAVTACGIDVQSGAYAVGLQSIVVLYAVTHGYQIVIRVGHDECGRGIAGNLFLI